MLIPSSRNEHCNCQRWMAGAYELCLREELARAWNPFSSPIMNTELNITAQASPDLWWFDVWFFNFPKQQKSSALSRNCTVDWEFELFPGTRQQQTPQLTANPTSIKGIQHSTVNWVARLCFLVSSVDQMYSQLKIFSIYGSGFIGNGIYSEMEKQAQNQCLDSTLQYPTESLKAGSESQGVPPPKSFSKDSAGLTPWCSSFVSPKPASLQVSASILILFSFFLIHTHSSLKLIFSASSGFVKLNFPLHFIYHPLIPTKGSN